MKLDKAIGVKNSCTAGTPPKMKAASLLLSYFNLGRDVQKNLRVRFVAWSPATARVVTG
jgi:hypothetical protein